MAKSVFVDGRSYLEVENGASLSIDNSSAIGLHNMGKAVIDGRLIVENVAGTSTFNNHCILNDGSFSIGSGAWVYLENTGGCGLTVSDAGVLHNYGEIWVYETNTAIRVKGVLENHNYIYLEPDQSHGLECRGGKVKNVSRATIRIEGSHFGVLVMEDISNNELGLFENYGVVRAERMDWWGVSVMDGEFYNYRGAQVKTMYKPTRVRCECRRGR